ncbi:MAG: TolC family protein [Mariprofundaceae bacterium]|nr:TolC family protein [Mariprofundaceae bacterium]
MLSNAGEVLTLKESVSQSMQHNRQLLAASQSVNQAKAMIKRAKGNRMPKIDMSTGWIYTNSPLQVFGNKLNQKSVSVADFSPNTLNHPSFQQNYQSRLGLSMPLFTGGALSAAQKEAEAQLEATALHFDFQKQQKMYQTIAVYIQARQSWEQIEVSKKSVEAAKKRWSDVVALKKKGMAIASDAMLAHVYVLRRQVAVDESSNNYQTNLEQLALLMGLSTSREQPELSQASVLMPEVSLEDLLLQAPEKRLDFLAMQQRLQSLSHSRQQAYASDLPQINLVASQDWNSTTVGLKNGSSSIGIMMRMNLFNGGADHAKQRVVESSYQALQWQIIDQRQTINNEVRQAWRSHKLAQNRLQREQEALKQTQEALRILSLRYGQGLETTASVLDAQVAMDISQVARIRAQYDVILANAALLLAAGLLSEKSIL